MVSLYHDRPDLYDLLHDDEAGDLAFYAGLASATVPPGGAVLELGCGSGRVMEALLDRRLAVTGLDSADAMLERARARLRRFGARATLVQGDMRAMAVGATRFDLVLIAANTFMHLDDHPAQHACLEGIRRHLRPGGTAVLDVANPFHVLALPQGILTLRRHVRDRSAGREVTVMGVLDVDPTAPRALDRLFFDEWEPGASVRRSVSYVELRLVFMPELELLLEAHGLGITDAYGDYDLGPYHPHAERMIVVVRPYKE